MPDRGEIDRRSFDAFVTPNRGAHRADVTQRLRHDADVGVVDLGEQILAMATAPIFLAPSAGFERGAWFAVHTLMSEVAVSGIPPSHLALDFTLPPAMTDEEFATVWETVDREATAFDVSIVTGHTGRYAGCRYPMVGGGTTMAVGEPDRLVRPDGAQAGDRVVVTKGPAIAASGLMAVLFESLLREGINSKADGEITEDAIDAATDRFDDASTVRDALTVAADGPVHAMCNAGQAGIYGGLDEMARVASVGIEIDRDAVPVQPGVMEACAYFGLNPWIANSRGALLAAVDPAGVDDVLAALDDEGIPAADVGVVTDADGLVVNGDPVDRPGTDPFWGAFEEYLDVLRTHRA